MMDCRISWTCSWVDTYDYINTKSMIGWKVCSKAHHNLHSLSLGIGKDDCEVYNSYIKQKFR